jgi:hypothetical protein
MHTFIPVPWLPSSLDRLGDTYPTRLVRQLDRIRRELEDRDGDQYAEFCWFAREYPRIYRHHVDHAAFRLRAIHARYVEVFNKLRKSVEKSDGNLFSTETDDITSRAIYWDFESYLTAVNGSLDALARVVGTAYKEQTPPSFNKLCGKSHLTGCADILRAAKTKWVGRLKAYRDCFMHYTPVDTVLTVGLHLRSNGWEMRCRIPTNPNSREILSFRYQRRVELVRYAISVWRHVSALDRSIADEIGRAYESGQFPQRTEHLFFIGARGESARKPSMAPPVAHADLSGAKDLRQPSLGRRAEGF